MMSDELKIAARFYGGPVDGSVIPVPVPLRLRTDIVWAVEENTLMDELEIPVRPVVSQLFGYRLHEFSVMGPCLERRTARVYIKEGVHPRSVVEDVRLAYQWPAEVQVYDSDPSSLAIS